MASVVLGVVGAIVAPFLGIPPNVGYMIGSALGAALFPEPGPDGPKLADLAIQNSTYGASIPILYGTYRMAGTVIWSTPLIEHAEEVDSGSGGGGATMYTYTCSFAIALCEGPMVGISRIWADGKLVYNKLADRPGNGIAFSAGSFRIYYGTEDQMPDPTIETDKGLGNVPAHRGLAYVVFTDLQLAKFGNRVPNLSFEIVMAGTNSEDVIQSDTVLLSDIVRDISRRCDMPLQYCNTEELRDTLRGFGIGSACAGRDAVSPLMQAYFFDAVESGRTVNFIHRGQPSSVVIRSEELLDIGKK